MKKYKLISKISLVLLLAMSLNLAMVPSIGAARLTAAKDTMTRIQVSGTGTATAGYTLSTTSVTDGFNIVTGSNNIICLDTDGTLGTDTTCLNAGGNAGEVKVNLIANGGLISGVVYTGDQIAAAIKTGLEAMDGDADDVYNVSYDETTDKYTIRGAGANDLNPAIGWALYAGADDAAATLGYTLDDTNLRGADAVSDNAVALNVVSGSNNTFTIQVDGTNSGTITITANPYTAATLVTEMDTRIDADATLTAAGKSVTVSYASNKFKITSNSTGGGSTIRVTEGATDFLKTVKLVGDSPVDGAAAAAGVVVADHIIVFTTTGAVANGGKVVITFPSGFDLTNIIEDDVDVVGSVAGELTTAPDCTGTEKAGVSKAAQVMTILLCAGDGGAFGAGETVTVEIGRNATASGTGSNQIANPTTIGLYQIHVETYDATPTIIDDTYIGVYIISDDSVLITATVDPVLALVLHGGTVLDFGTLEPNAFHKLGGARNAYGYIDLTNVGTYADGGNEGKTITVRGIIYELSDDGVIAATSHAKVDIVDNENNYLTKEQVASNLYRAINNYDGSLVRANVAAGDTDKVYVMATQIGTAGNAYTLATNDADVTVSDTTFTDGYNGYNNNSNTLVYAAGVDVGNGATGTNLVVSTNAVSGYVLTIQNSAADLTNGTETIPDWTGQYGWGIYSTAQSARYGDATANIIAAGYRSSASVPGTMSSTAATLASYSGTAAGDNVAIEYNLRIPPDQAAGLYTDTVTYILTSTF